MRDYLAKYPRLTGVLFGALLVLLTNGINLGVSSSYNDKIVSENERLTKLHMEYVQTSSAKIDSLKKENHKLHSKKTTYRIVKPDGTIEERTTNEIESEDSLSASVKSEFEDHIMKKLDEQQAELSKIVSESKKLNLGVGVTSDLEYYGVGSYNVIPPFTIQGIIKSSGTVGVGVGIEL